MHVDRSGPASLSAPALARRLADLCGDERNVQVDFLLHLDVFDQRRDWAAAGYGSLWAYCLEVLHLREGAAYRRIEAMKLLRRFPSVEPALRDGRLCLTTLAELGKVLTEENLSDLLARAAFLSKADTERLVVSIRPRAAPRDGIRKLASGAATLAAVPPAGPGTSDAPPPVDGALALAPADASELAPAAAPERSPAAALAGPQVGAASGLAPAPFALASVPSGDAVPARPVGRPELRPVSGDTYSLRVTLDAACKADLDQLVSLLSHKTGGNLAEVLREAIRCGIQKHGRRRGAVEPERKRAGAAAERKPPAPAAARGPANEPSAPVSTDEPLAMPDPRNVPIDVCRAVWKRSGGRCEWTSADGKRCGSTWELEFGHLTPAAAGGLATIENIQLQCDAHNQFEADQFFGREHMDRFRGRRDFRWRK